MPELHTPHTQSSVVPCEHAGTPGLPPPAGEVVTAGGVGELVTGIRAGAGAGPFVGEEVGTFAAVLEKRLESINNYNF